MVGQATSSPTWPRLSPLSRLSASEVYGSP